MTEQTLKALRLAMDCITDAAKIAGPSGAPSGVVYAALNEHGMTLNVYQQILGAMTRAGKITVEFNCIKLA